MNYRDALAACLEAIRNGQAPERAIAAYPEHAVRLREDVALSESVRAFASSQAQPSEAAAGRASRRLSSQLSTLRTQRQASVPSRAFWRMPFLQGLAFAAVALVAIGFLALAGGILGDAQTAEAETIDGVVVGTTAEGIVVQTEDGLQTVALDQASDITDENGAAVEAKAIEAGQVIVVRVKRQSEGVLKAIAIQRRAAGSLAEWCRLHPVRCQEVEPKLPPAALACPPSAIACALPTPATGAALERVRLQDLAERCQRTGGVACEELRIFCRNNAGLCAVVTGWLRTLLDLPDDIRERIRLQSQRCQGGSILDCRELRLLCERTNQSCPVLTTPNRPAIKATPRQPF